ncbi:MAG: hypothetical protein RID90_14925 [Marinovum algicola]
MLDETKRTGVAWHDIVLGKPMPHAFVESFQRPLPGQVPRRGSVLAGLAETHTAIKR